MSNNNNNNNNNNNDNSEEWKVVGKKNNNKKKSNAKIIYSRPSSTRSNSYSYSNDNSETNNFSKSKQGRINSTPRSTSHSLDNNDTNYSPRSSHRGNYDNRQNSRKPHRSSSFPDMDVNDPRFCKHLCKSFRNDFGIKIKNNLLTSENIDEYMVNIKTHHNFTKHNLNPIDAATYFVDIIEFLLGEAAELMHYRMNDLSDYVELVKKIIDKLSVIKKFGKHEIRTYNVTNYLLWIEPQVPINCIVELYSYANLKLKTHPFKENGRNETAFSSLVARFKKNDKKFGPMSLETFNERHELIKNSIDFKQRKLIIQSVVNMITENKICTNLIKFKMLFLINPESFAKEVIDVFLDNCNSVFAGMKNATETLYVPKFIEMLDDLFVDYSNNVEYNKTLVELGLDKLFAETIPMSQHELLNLFDLTLVKYFDTSSDHCIINFDENFNQESSKTRSQLLSLAYLIAAFKKVNTQNNNITQIIIDLLLDNKVININILLDVCRCMTRNNNCLRINTYIIILERILSHPEINIKTDRLYQIAEDLNPLKEVFKIIDQATSEHQLKIMESNNNLKLSDPLLNLPIIKRCSILLNAMYELKSENDIKKSSNSPKSLLTKAQRKKLNRKNRRNNNENDEIKITITNSNYSPKPNFAPLLSISMAASLPSSTFAPVSVSHSYKSVSFFDKLSKFDNSVSYEDEFDNAMSIIKEQLKKNRYSDVFNSYFDEILTKSRKGEEIVKTQVFILIKEFLDFVMNLKNDDGTPVATKEGILDVVNTYSELLEDKKEDLACIEENYNIIKAEIENYFNF